MAPNEFHPHGRRRRTSWQRRVWRSIRIVGPFLFLLGTLLLSAGVVRVVERSTLPIPEERRRDATNTNVDPRLVYEGETLVEYMAAQREAIAFTPLDVTGPDSPLDRAIQRSALDDRIEALEALLEAQSQVEPLEDPSVDPDSDGAEADGDQLTISRSSTSNVRTAPPGMRGGAPRSP